MIDPTFASWLSGFIDGEGCFVIAYHSGGRYHAPRFKLNLRKDDLPLLEEILAVTGLGTVCQSGSGIKNPQMVWHINSKAHCLALTRLLDVYPLRSRKRRDYEIWREAVFVHNLEGQSPKLAVLKEAIQDVRKYRVAPL